ncbi:MAG: hypothetical protein AAFV43_13390 [Planctomycetota bacterium]
MPSAENQEASPLTVGVCPTCDELFTLPDVPTDSRRLACPYCDTAIAMAELKTRSVRSAVALAGEPEPQPKPDPPPEPKPSATPTLSETLGWTAAPTVASSIDDAEHDSLVSEADELLRSVEAAREPRPVTSAPEPMEELAEEPKPAADLLKEFGFDFGATPLKSEGPPSADVVASGSTAAEPSDLEPLAAELVATTPVDPEPRVAAEASIDIAVRQRSTVEEPAGESLAGTSVDRLLHDADGGDHAPTAAELLLTGADESRGGLWTGPLMAAAGVLFIAGPAAYLTWSGMWGGGPTGAPLAAAGEPFAAADDDVRVDPPVPQAAAKIAEDPYDGSATAPLVADADDRYGRVEAATYEVEADPQPPAAWTLPPADAAEPAAIQPAAPESAAEAPTSRYAKQDPPPAVPPEFALPTVDNAKEPRAMPAEIAAVPESASDLLTDLVAAPVTLPIAGAPTYTVDELLGLAQQAQADAEAFAAGSLSDPEQAPFLGQAYARLCKLSEAVTLIDPAITRRGRREAEFAALDVFRKLWLEASPRESSRVIAHHWIDWTERPHGGVFFAGKPSDEPRKAGEVYRYEFMLDGVSVPVVTTAKLDARRFLSARAQEIGVLGVVVESPAERIAGYVGGDERVVWARKTVPLREPGKL